MLAIACLPLRAYEGIPFSLNFASEEYNGHNRNFDIIADGYGNVFVANFEGLLYYNGITWTMIHTPGISRITALARDDKGIVWFGGYNVFGHIAAHDNGKLYLNTLVSDKTDTHLGEVVAINVTGGNVIVSTLSGITYRWDGKALQQQSTTSTEETTPTINGHKINDIVTLPNGEKIYATAGNGLTCVTSNGTAKFTINHSNGLCDDNVNALSYDGNGRLWGATDNGIFCLAYPSAFTNISSPDGLNGEVQSILEHHGMRYVGTMQGLFIDQGTHYVQIPAITQACWQLAAATQGDGLYAATATGLYRVRGTTATPITTSHTLAVYPQADGSCLAGEVSGLYHITAGGQRTQVANIENVTKILGETDGTLFVQDVYGKVYFRTTGSTTFAPINAVSNLANDAVAALFVGNNGIDVISNSIVYVWDKSQQRFTAADTLATTFTYPKLVYTGNHHYIWITDNAGKNITAFLNRVIDKDYAAWLQTIDNESITAMYTYGENVLFGSKSGIINWFRTHSDPSHEIKPQVFIKTIKLDEDSIVWGGFNPDKQFAPALDLEKFNLSSNHRNVSFAFATVVEPVFGDINYRYRLKSNDKWSSWSTRTIANFYNLSPGNYTFEVQAMDAFGRLSEPQSVAFHIDYPWYMRWWSILLYLALLGALGYAFVRFRMARLLKEKARLEGIVDERTAELRQQKEEVEEKSVSLQKALTDLAAAQNTLVRQEKMATVGKLTKGLIDRILNPINYINNFSHLSEGLADDIIDDIEDDKDNITPDTYDDLKDVAEMIKGNLAKIVEHGTNTSRILKAMEEMLKERVGKMSTIDIAEICRQDVEMLRKYYEDDINQLHILTPIEGCDTPVNIIGDGAQLSKSIMSMLGNSVYAIRKKYNQAPYEAPTIKLSMETTDDLVKIHIYDNGIGIEDTIKDEIFAPFFTTKPTSEASGVGLYLSKETIQAHDGDITVESVKDQFTQFTITLKKSANQ